MAAVNSTDSHQERVPQLGVERDALQRGFWRFDEQVHLERPSATRLNLKMAELRYGKCVRCVCKRESESGVGRVHAHLYTWMQNQTIRVVAAEAQFGIPRPVWSSINFL